MQHVIQKVSKPLFLVAAIPGLYLFAKESVLLFNTCKKYRLEGNISKIAADKITKIIGQSCYYNGIHPETNISLFITNQDTIITYGSSEFAFGAYLGIPELYLKILETKVDTKECLNTNGSHLINQANPIPSNPSLDAIEFSIAQAALLAHNKRPFLNVLSFIIYPAITLSLAGALVHRVYKDILLRSDPVTKLKMATYPSPPMSIRIVTSQNRALSVVYPLALLLFGVCLYTPLKHINASYHSQLVTSADQKVAKVKSSWCKGSIEYIEYSMKKYSTTLAINSNMCVSDKNMNRGFSLQDCFDKIILAFEKDFINPTPGIDPPQLHMRLRKLEDFKQSHKGNLFLSETSPKEHLNIETDGTSVPNLSESLITNTLQAPYKLFAFFNNDNNSDTVNK